MLRRFQLAIAIKLHQQTLPGLGRYGAIWYATNWYPCQVKPCWHMPAGVQHPARYFPNLTATKTATSAGLLVYTNDYQTDIAGNTWFLVWFHIFLNTQALLQSASISMSIIATILVTITVIIQFHHYWPMILTIMIWHSPWVIQWRPLGYQLLTHYCHN